VIDPIFHQEHPVIAATLGGFQHEAPGQIGEFRERVDRGQMTQRLRSGDPALTHIALAQVLIEQRRHNRWSASVAPEFSAATDAIAEALGRWRFQEVQHIEKRFDHANRILAVVFAPHER
jgi:hypothetical protein